MNAICSSRRVSAQRNQAPRPPSVHVQILLEDLFNAKGLPMSTRLVREKFASVGASLHVRELRNSDAGSHRTLIDVRHAPEGQFFDLAYNARRPAVLRVENLRPEAGELTLVVEDAPEIAPSRRGPAERFVCRREQQRWVVDRLTAARSQTATPASCSN